MLYYNRKMAKVNCDICGKEFKNEEALGFHKKAKHSDNSPKQETKKSKKSLYTILALIAVAIILFLIFGPMFSSGSYDTFAQCLTDAGAKMYGAYWCPHCVDQKEMFGQSWDYMNYIECSLPNRAGQTIECINAKIQSYPTWEFQNGQRLEGVLSFEELGDLTGCPVVQDE